MSEVLKTIYHLSVNKCIVEAINDLKPKFCICFSLDNEINRTHHMVWPVDKKSIKIRHVRNCYRSLA